MTARGRVPVIVLFYRRLTTHPLVFKGLSDRDSVGYASNVQDQMQHHDFAYRDRSGDQAMKKFNSTPMSSRFAPLPQRHGSAWTKPMREANQIHAPQLLNRKTLLRQDGDQVQSAMDPTMNRNMLTLVLKSHGVKASEQPHRRTPDPYAISTWSLPSPTTVFHLRIPCGAPNCARWALIWLSDVEEAEYRRGLRSFRVQLHGAVQVV
jgi:hypothetical protein